MAATDRSRTSYPALLVPDPDINSDTFAADSSFTALYPRPGQPIPTTSTAMALAAHDTQSSGTLNVLTQQGGIVGPQGASFLWKDSGATDYYGWDAPTVITGWRSLVWATTPAIAQPVALPLQSGRLLVHYAYGTGGDQIYQSGRNSDGTLITPALVDLGAVGASYVSPATLQLPSGKILLLGWIQDTLADTATMRMLYSDDDGGTWALGSSGCLPSTISTAAGTGYLVLRTRAAYANGQILCLVWLRNYDTAEDYREELRQYASSDGGHTFSLIWSSDRSLTGSSQNGGGYPDIAVVGSAFFVAYVDLINNGPFVARLESAYDSVGAATLIDAAPSSEAWATQSGGPTGYYFTAGDLWICTDETGALYISGRIPTVGNQWVIYQSTDGGLTWAAMARSALSSGAGKWWDAADSGTYPADGCGRWLRGRILVATCHLSNPSAYDVGSLSLIALGGYTTVTMPGYDAWRVDNRQVTWGQTYLPFDEPQDCGWSKATTGAPTDAVTSGLLVLAAGVGATILYSVVPGGTVTGGIGAVWALDTTSGSARVRLRVADVTEGYSLTLTLSTTTLTAVDEISGGTIASAAATGEVHVLAWITAGKASVWYRVVTDALESTRAWTRLVDDEALQDDAGATITASSLQWGHAVTGGSTWRSMAWIDDGSASYAGTGLGSAVLPDDLLGRRYSLQPTYLDLDTAISATGGPTYPGDAWTLATAYESGPERLDPAVSPSERDGLLLDPTATHELIWDVHTSNTLLWGRPLAVALLSTNIQTATLYGYNGAAWVNLGGISAVVTAAAAYTRTGRGVRVNSGGTQRWVERNALAGATIGLGGGKFRKVTGNTEGQIGASTSVQAILHLEDVDDTEGASGNCTIWMPRIISYMAQPSEYRRFKVTIPVTTTPDGILRLGKVLIGSLVLLPIRPANGRETTYEPQRVTSRPPGGVRSLKNLGPMRRIVNLPMSDLMPTAQIYQTSPDPGYAKLSSHASAVPTSGYHGEALSLVGLTTELQGAFVVYLPMVLQSSQLTTLESCPIPQHAVYGRILEPLTLRAERGNEGINAAFSVGGLVVEEEP
jgi:hypothetical protein